MHEEHNSSSSKILFKIAVYEREQALGVPLALAKPILIETAAAACCSSHLPNSGCGSKSSLLLLLFRALTETVARRRLKWVRCGAHGCRGDCSGLRKTKKFRGF